MEISATLIWSLIFGGIGVIYLIYGRKQKKLLPFITGLLLIAVPYSIGNPYMVVISGITLMTLPYFLQL